MDEDKYNILYEIEEHVKKEVSDYRLKTTSCTVEQLIDIVFGHFGNCIDMENKDTAKRKMTSIYSYLFHYAYSQENKPTKSKQERLKYHEQSLRKKAQTFKELLYTKEDLLEDKGLDILHRLLDKMILDPYTYMKEPTETSIYVFRKKYIEEKLLLILSYRFDQPRCVRKIKDALKAVDTLLKNDG